MIASAHAMLVFAWFALLCLMLVCYVVTDGFDLGTGIVSLVVRDESERGLLFRSIAQVWDANETWLVVLGGALFGAFPKAYALILSQLYLPILTMVFGFILRGAAIEFRHLARRKRGWDIAFGVASLVVALSQGWVLGRILTGLAAQPGGTAFTAVTAIGVASGYVLLGATHVVRKIGGPLGVVARRVAIRAVVTTVVAAAVLSVGTQLVSPVGRPLRTHPGLALALGILAASAFAGTLISLRRGGTEGPFLGAVVLFLASLCGLALSVYPNLVPGRLTLEQAVAGDTTLVFMLFGIGTLMPVMLGYNLYQYLVFRGAIESPGAAP